MQEYGTQMDLWSKSRIEYMYRSREIRQPAIPARVEIRRPVLLSVQMERSVSMIKRLYVSLKEMSCGTSYSDHTTCGIGISIQAIEY